MEKINRILLISIAGFAEKLSFYVLLSVLVLYLISPEVGYSKEESSAVYSFFMYAVYFSPILFGLAADLSNRKMVIGIGILAVVLGYFLLILVSDSISGLYAALGIAAAGVGAFRANMPVLVGDNSYRADKPKFMLQAYMIYAVALAAGAFLAGFLAADLRGYFSDIKWVIAAAGLLMLPTMFLCYFLIFRFSPAAGVRKKLPNRNLFITVLLLIALLVLYGIAVYADASYSYMIAKDIMFLDAVGIVFIAFGILATALLGLKVLKISFRKLLIFFLGFIVLSGIFYIYGHYEIIKAPVDNLSGFFALVIVLTIIEFITLAVVKYFVYVYTLKYKGLVFGILISLNVFTYKYLAKSDLGNNSIIFTVATLFVLVFVLWVVFLRKRNKFRGQEI